MVHPAPEEEQSKFVPKERLITNLENELKVEVPSDKKLSGE